MFLVFTVAMFFLNTTWKGILPFHANVADGTAGQVAKGLRGVMAGATVFIVEFF